MKNARKSLIGLVALGSALVMPMAFAQSDTPTATQDPAAQSAPPADQGAAPAAATPTPDAKKVTWADLDADKDGTLSKTEAAPLASLSQVFDQADSDADGKLTADEYKAYVAKAGGATDPQG